MIHESNGRDTPQGLLRRARAGDSSALGSLLELYRNYLAMLARTQLGVTVRLPLNPSDLVQETFLEAQRDFSRFRGTTEGEVLAWLRRILVRTLADQVKRGKARRRGWGRQVSLEELLERSSLAFHHALARDISTPSAQAAGREQAVLLADALARLSEDYREVIVLRHLDRLKFEEIAARMGRSAGAVRMLWVRAIEKLRISMEDPS